MNDRSEKDDEVLRVQLPAVTGGRRRVWWLVAALGIAVVGVVALMVRYPRYVFLSDVRRARTIIVDWDRSQAYGTDSRVAFEIDSENKEAFERELTEHVGLDYFRSQSTVTPMIGIYLVDEENKCLGYYVIRRARGGGRCPAMESLRNMASKGRPLSQDELDAIFNDSLHSK